MAKIIRLPRRLFTEHSYFLVVKCSKQLASGCTSETRKKHLKNKTLLNDTVPYRFHNKVNDFWNKHTRNFHLSSYVNKSEKIVTAPPFPESVTEGDLIWEKNVGDKVVVDEIVCEIETDKTSIGVPAPVAGTIVERYAEGGSTVKAGQKLFRLVVSGEVTADEAKKTPAAAPAPKPAAPASPPPAAAPPPPVQPAPAAEPPPQSKAVAPKPKAEAPKPKAEAPKPKAEAPPTAAKPKPPAAPPKVPPPSIPQTSQLWAKVPPADPTKEIRGTRTEFKVKTNRMRQRISQRLKDSQNINAALTTFNEIDMSSIIEFRKNYQDVFTKKYGIKLGFMSAFVKAAAYALKDQPVVNAVIDNGEIVYRDYIDMSIAVATPKGLVVPVIRNAGEMNYAEIEKSMHELAEKARLGKLAVEDMDGGTFTISNGGVFGSLMGTPIINMPQSAILGMHATFERPVAIKKEVVIRPMMYVALTYDHRLVDGREAVLFLRKIKSAVEDPRIMIAGL